MPHVIYCTPELKVGLHSISHIMFDILNIKLCVRLRLKCDDTRRNQISSFGETDKSI
jgi:hypothetical protein